jgi:hypothetical protein
MYIELDDIINMMEQWRNGQDLSGVDRVKIAQAIGEGLCQYKFDELLKAISKFEDESPFRCRSLVDKLRNILRNYTEKARKAEQKFEQQKVEITIELRTIINMANSVGMANTHSEKNARLRGLIEYIGSRIEDLRNDYSGYLCAFYDSAGWHFKSLYPIRQMIDKLRSSEMEVNELRKKLGESPKKEDDDISDWALPF